MSSFASRFKAGSDIAKDLINTYEMGQRKKAFGDIASAQESSDFTAEERAAMEAKANAVDANGQPIYTMGTDAQGGVTSTINKAAVPGAEEDAYAPAAMARSGVSYLGKNYDAPLSDGQRLGAQQQAMAGVLDKSGDIEGAMRYRQQAQQGVLADMQLTQAKRMGAREDKADAVTATLEGVDKEAGEWMKSRLKNPDGTERVATVDDHLATTQFRANKLMGAGRSSEAGALMKDFNAQALVKIQLETAQRTEALKMTSAALAAGDLNAVKDFYNKFTPDGAQVVSVKRDEKGQILIERTTDDGRPMPPHTLKDTGELSAALNTFSDPMALYNWSQNEFKNNLSMKADGRAEKSLVIQQAQLGIQAGTAAMSNRLHGAQIDELTQKTSDRKEYAELQAEYGAAIDSGDAKAIDAAAKKIHSFGRTGKAGAEQSAFTLKVDAIMRANPGMALSKATTMAMEKAGQSPDAYFAELLKPSAGMSMPVDDAVARTKAAYPDWRSVAPGATFANQSEFDMAVKSGKVKIGDRVSIGGRTATYK